MLGEFQQLALAVVLIAEGAIGGGLSGARIELELVTADSDDVLFVDPNDPAEISKARAVVYALAGGRNGAESMTALDLDGQYETPAGAVTRTPHDRARLSAWSTPRQPGQNGIPRHAAARLLEWPCKP